MHPHFMLFFLEKILYNHCSEVKMKTKNIMAGLQFLMTKLKILIKNVPGHTTHAEYLCDILSHECCKTFENTWIWELLQCMDEIHFQL